MIFQSILRQVGDTERNEMDFQQFEIQTSKMVLSQECYSNSFTLKITSTKANIKCYKQEYKFVFWVM